MENTTNTANKFMVTGLFKDKESAECAYDALTSRGYDKEDTNVVMSDDTRNRYYSEDNNTEDTELGSKALEGSGAGAAIGGTVGAAIAAIAAIGTSVVLPGIGLVVAGPLAAALVGAGAGGLTGGLIGALIGSGIPEEHAEAYEAGIKTGGIMIEVRPRTAEDAAAIESKWRECGGEQIYSNASERNTNAVGVSEANTSQRRDNPDNYESEVSIPVIEEELQVDKREIQTGGVRVETNITEHPVEETVTLRDEEINVEHRPVNRAASDREISAIKEGEFVVTQKDEQAVVAKQPRVVEEVVVGKEVTEHDETVKDTVRRTEVDVEELRGDQLKNRSKTAE